MGLIECPECIKSISSSAESCPSCGYPLHTRAGAGRPGRRVIIVLAICLGLFGAIVGFTVGNPAFGVAGAAAAAMGAVRLVMTGSQ